MAAVDYGSNTVFSATRAETITTSDSLELSYVTRGIYVGTAGDVVVVTTNGDTATFKNAVAGSIIPIRAKQVKATNTTASNLVGLS